MRTARRHISLLNPAGVTNPVEPGVYTPTPEGRERLDLSERSVHRTGRKRGLAAEHDPRGFGRRGLLIALAVLLVLLLAAGALALVTMKAGITGRSEGLATIEMPLGGGTIEHVSAVHGPHAQGVRVTLHGQQVFPRGHLRAGELVQVQAVVKRPGWVSWLTGSTEHVQLTVRTPTASLRSQFLTLHPGAPLRVSYDRPIAAVSYGPLTGHLHLRRLAVPQSQVTLPRNGAAGSLFVAAVPRSWETTQPTAVSYFPPGASAAAVASPPPGAQIEPGTAIALTFSAPVSKVLGHSLPVVTPHTTGTWQTTGPHTIVFHPSGYGYGLGAKVTIALPGGVRLVGATDGSSAATADWSVPAGSTLRLQQLLAQLGFLPLRFNGPHIALNPQAQEAAAVNPPHGSFTWRYGNVPSALRGFWAPGEAGVMTRGAVMAFESEHEMTTDGIAGSTVWRALLAAAIAHQRSSFGYTFVDVTKGSPEELTLWHSGRTVLTTPVNTGIPGRPTESGTFPVYEHIESGTMSGTNPDGSHYEDPGIPWISYFNGGDALHGFDRASYGFPQSLGCVEIPPTTAGHVWPYTPIGTLVHIAE